MQTISEELVTKFVKSTVPTPQAHLVDFVTLSTSITPATATTVYDNGELYYILANAFLMRGA
ncbi:hypothetical protein CROQUDRAFT_92541 [Cronartium quercuum f. sp. fusiforme G11]|uniref:Uncharacterized protein n=1 Tax=Cronartium quercuum f. sp. fusiforme G11 TaxID=708437 RepID=A0A9P6NIE9_9BASI|nr:hypothetical protein CROQUDRAFT_92541 [Cronartium quercuum f. sp. fusiforme G11]